MNIFGSKRWRDKSFIAIVSTGRTGTKFFSSILNDPSSGVSCLHEPEPNLDLEGSSYVKGDISFKKVENIISTSRRKILRDIPRENIYLESNGGLSYVLDPLAKVFPKLKIIHILRDPRTFIASAVNRVAKKDNKLVQKYAYDENWLLRAKDIEGDPYNEIWDNLSIYEKFMWGWNYRNQKIIDGSANCEHIIFKFEDLFYNEPSKKFKQLYDFIGIDFDEEKLNLHLNQKVNKNEHQFSHPFDKWSEKEKENLDNICGELMKKFNY